MEFDIKYLKEMLKQSSDIERFASARLLLEMNEDKIIQSICLLESESNEQAKEMYEELIDLGQQVFIDLDIVGISLKASVEKFGWNREELNKAIHSIMMVFTTPPNKSENNLDKLN